MLNTVFALGIVLSLFFGATVLIKRTWPQSVTRRMPSEVLEVLAIAEMQPKQQWMLMRFGGKLLLVCQQAHETRVIAEVTDQQEIDRLVALCEKPHQTGAALGSFSLKSQFRTSRAITG
ncbi:MAG: flagellar biosynthetic protein FliO [Pirellula sp.]